MTTYPIDTLAAVRELEQAGFESNQAEAVANLLAHTGQELATKSDLAEAVKTIRQELGSIRHELAVMRWLLGIQSAFVLAMALRVFGVL